MLDSSDDEDNDIDEHNDSVDWDHDIDAIDQEYDTDENQQDIDNSDCQDEELDEEEEMDSMENSGENWDNSVIPDTSVKLSDDTDQPDNDNIDGSGIDGDGFQAVSVKNLQDDIEKGRAVKHQIGTCKMYTCSQLCHHLKRL